MVQSTASRNAEIAARHPLVDSALSIGGQIWSGLRRTVARTFAKLRMETLSPGGAPFPAADPESICEQLNVDERAIADGSRDEPRSFDSSPTGAQLEIIQHFRNLQRQALAKAAKRRKKVLTLRSRIDFPQQLDELREIETQAESRIERLHAKFLSKLELLGERELQQLQHYEAFREENRLNRVAVYPRSKLLIFLAVAALIGAGAVAIGRLSGFALDGTPVMGAEWAVGVSLFVVLIPLILAAAIFRYVNHVGDFKQAIGLLAGIAAIAMILALAMFSAVFVTVDAGTTWTSVLAATLQFPPSLDFGPPGWAVFGVTILLGLLAFLIGYRADDAYPEYGVVQRSYYRARAERNALASRIHTQIDSIIDEAGSELTRLLRTLKARVKHLESLVLEARSQSDAIASFEQTLEDTCNIVLDRYRRGNTGARSTESPAYFAERVTLDTGLEAPTKLANELDQPLEEVFDGMKEFESSIERSRRQLRDLNWRAVEGLDSRPGTGIGGGE